MSDPVSALNGASAQGFAAIREVGPLGMITLRAKGLKSLDKAIKAVTGTKLPAQRRIEVNGDRACGWMSPDEYLLILPYADVSAALASLAKSLAGEHYLAVDVSDARAVFRVEGDRAAEVLAKLVPVDFDRLEPGELRRSRTAQVAAAMWKQDQGFTLVCFRSVARYVFDLLANASR
ncbi:sarcosine oxidase subunit gamma family protein [Tabrizicola sp.]|uniref:sarcosine oxidase subunit gamma n=1 Tax=Tabrizicola sp. TaxID=2005166 RepID=UPI001A5D7D05|nr:sarcosine oxidase subunit gamma family protein [Tabrizicola sp.]MBL9074022.1 sarcosine oxidase subunit gamma [Tabrizicola sp.]